MRFKIRHKINEKVSTILYKYVEDLPVIDSEIIAFKKIIENSKKERFILVKSELKKDFTLYDLSGKRIYNVLSISEIK